VLTAHDVLRFRRRQASMTVSNVESWHRGDNGRWVWTLELEDDSGTWVLSSGSNGLHLYRRGSRGMVVITEELWASVLQAHRASIVSALVQDLEHAIRRVKELRDALKELRR